MLGPLTTDQVPVPEEGLFPARVIDAFEHSVVLDVFVAVVGGDVTVTVIVFE